MGQWCTPLNLTKLQTKPKWCVLKIANIPFAIAMAPSCLELWARHLSLFLSCLYQSQQTVSVIQVWFMHVSTSNFQSFNKTFGRSMSSLLRNVSQ